MTFPPIYSNDASGTPVHFQTTEDERNRCIITGNSLTEAVPLYRNFQVARSEVVYPPVMTDLRPVQVAQAVTVPYSTGVDSSNEDSINGDGDDAQSSIVSNNNVQAQSDNDGDTASGWPLKPLKGETILEYIDRCQQKRKEEAAKSQSQCTPISSERLNTLSPPICQDQSATDNIEAASSPVQLHYPYQAQQSSSSGGYRDQRTHQELVTPQNTLFDGSNIAGSSDWERANARSSSYASNSTAHRSRPLTPHRSRHLPPSIPREAPMPSVDTRYLSQDIQAQILHPHYYNPSSAPIVPPALSSTETNLMMNPLDIEDCEVDMEMLGDLWKWTMGLFE